MRHLEFLTDPYLIKTRPKSVLCFPVLKQGQVSGLIYLENNLITGAFTSARTNLLELLAAQTSISIENERLFQESQAAFELRLNLEKEKQINHHAEAARKELHALFMQAPAAICLLAGPDHVYTLMNDKFFDFFGGDPNFIGKPIREAAPELVEQGFVDILDGVYKTREPFIGSDVPCLVTQIDGTVKQLYFDFVFQPSFDPMGKINGIMTVGSDVSEKFESRAKLQEALKARDEFLSIASHELKTPVTSLKLQLQMARRGVKPEENLSPSPAKLAKVFDISTKQIERLIVLIDDLLDVSRIEAGKLSLNREVVDISSLINEVVDRVGEQFLSAKCPIEVETGDSFTIYGDQFRIEQVVVNLLTNALKYGKGKPVRVSVKSLPEGIRISVHDFGLGIAKENHAMVFERFERAVSHNNISGLGLGLYITKQIVVAHGGQIHLESELGKGSTFYVDLPKTPPS
ncbi:MAG TPA: ATP-binding protein [Bacteriovoracaceae bacterium]|nr:ATP-binding protein [Bacteriovoracaceae bacterium]